MAHPKRAIEDAFQAWYRAGRPSIRSFASTYTDPLSGRHFSQHTIDTWRERHGWVVRANELDKEATANAERTLIEERQRMLETQKSVGRLLQQKGVRYYRGDPQRGIPEREVEQGWEAIQAIQAGIKIERESVGLPSMLVAFRGMSEEQLREFIAGQQRELEMENEQGFEEGVVPVLEGADQ